MADKKKLTKSIIYSLLGIAILIAILYPRIESQVQKSALDSKKEGAGPGGKSGKKKVSAQYIVIQPKLMVETVNAAGSLTADEEVDLAFESSGRVVLLDVKEGKRVHKGSVIAKINDDELVAQREKLLAQIKLAESKEYRQRTLLQKDAVSRESYDQSLTELNSLRADLEQVDAKIKKCKIIAPFDGTIGFRNLSLGAYATPSTVVAHLVRLRPIKVDFSIPEKYAGIVSPGKKIQFKVDGKMNTFSANVYAVEPKVDPNTRTIPVRARYANTKEELLPGRFVSVEVFVQSFPKALAIPSESLVPEIDGEKVYVVHKGKAKAIKVFTGIRTESEIQVLNGLNTGDTVVTTGILQMKDGVKVKLVDKKSKKDRS